MSKKIWAVVVLGIIAIVAVSGAIYLQQKKTVKDCYVTSLQTAQKGHYQLTTDGTCPQGYYLNRLLCLESVTWCEPIKKPNSGPCVQIVIPAKNPYTGEIIEFPTPCDVPENWKTTESADFSTWQTYRNEKYGFEVKYPSNFEVRDLTLENIQYVKNLLLLVGICDTRFTTSCNGTTIHVYNGDFREPSISEGTEVKKFEKGNITFWLGGDNDILSTFKFIK